MAEFSNYEFVSTVAFCESARVLNSFAALSHRQALIAAIVLNRADWLWDQSYTIVTAMRELGPAGLALVYAVEQVVCRGS
ncbi:hypothetical protein OVY01_05560 [Robbsia sp. Bb-Pol-6]|uniref:Uncharacterized protein n=1 Tax=Robbsia betulipollinis TaxID=2981849 RepID=A0ABT3ZJJ0_9BURK|nr:hypothetical protein [Robbsia betulipollinis]MCY0386711.1 hypothetical protein [Robbsia betulipollinis]